MIKPLPALVQLIGDEKELYRIAAGVRSQGKIEIYIDGIKYQRIQEKSSIQIMEYQVYQFSDKQIRSKSTL